MADTKQSLLNTVFDYIPPGGVAFIAYVLALQALVGGFIMSLITVSN